MSSDGSGDEDASTQETLRAPPSRQRRLEETRFTPGTLIAHRYRIVSLLGEGGMGEVYRADDIRLGQRVALKYLPPALEQNPDALERLYAEVRIGRQVSHPNVCRLYDLVELDGHHFIAMEYVDGEDLASLLRRIGRLPGDKALALARDICAGLAAAHDRGVVHRDLKPANVMIDGAGSARITDFGLAALAGDARGFAGTPLYMAPEQLAGGEATPRSDIYALGLVLYELFTGKTVFESRTIEALREEHAKPKSRPSSLVKDVDPEVERAILHCLEENPAARPQTARSVIAALPGGDPLRDAIEAGETPSPEMVAAAGQVGDLQPRTAWALLALLFVFLAASAVLRPLITLEGALPELKSPEALADRAREIIAANGGAGHPRDVDHRWEKNESYTQRAITLNPGGRHSPSALWFSYRESPATMIPFNRRRVLSDDPPEVVPGMASVVLDPDGTLVRFRRVPSPGGSPAPSTNWAALFSAAGLDPSTFVRVEPRGGVAFEHDERMAWRGPFPQRPGVALHVEAASRRHEPVYFEVFEPWRATTPARSGPRFTFSDHVFAVLYPVVLLFSAILARRNVLRGRSDRRGALRIALAVGVTNFLGAAAVAEHVPNLAAEWDLLILLGGTALVYAAFVWILYLAVEPFVRRRWPRMLISWMRLVGGRARDPLVARDVLGGAVAGALGIVLATLGSWVAQRAAGAAPTLAQLTHVSQDRALGFGFVLFGVLAMAILFALGWLALALLLRLLLRNDRAAFVLLLVIASFAGIGDKTLPAYLIGLAVLAPLVIVFRRVGAVALAAAFYFYYTLFFTPMTPDVSVWYAGRGFVVLAVLASIGCWAFVTALAGKPIFGSLFAEPETAA